MNRSTDGESVSAEKEQRRFRYPIRFKIFVFSLIPTLALLLTAVLNHQFLNTLGHSSERILSENYKSIKAAQKIQQLLEEGRNRLLLDSLGYESRGEIPLLFQPEIAEQLDFCRNNITEPGEREILNQITGQYDRYLAMFRKVADSRDGPDSGGENLIGFISLSAGLSATLNELVAINERAMERAQLDTNRFARQALRYSVALIITAILFTIGISFFWSRRLSQPLAELAATLAGVREGSGNYPLMPVRTRDEIGFLTREFNRLFERLQAYDQLNMEKLLTEREKVHQAELAKARFIADLSHQLKTPMTSLSMSLGLLAEKSGSLSVENRTRLFGTANEDCARLAGLINELVDIAKLENMVRPPQKELLDIGRVVRETLRPLMGQAKEKGILTEIKVAEDVPLLAIDSMRFPWILTNLVGNAIRYTDPGGSIVFSVESSGRRVRFQCRDTGSGIDPRYVPKIFDRYTQFSEREKSGTIGLGLAIVKEIIEQHGGDIAVESVVGQGTTFRFWLPIDQEREQNEISPDR
jgi:signal transduction histidine kinase